MAITATARGTNTKAASSMTATIVPSGNLAAGSLAVLVVAVDNSDSAGNAHSTFTVTDTKSNTWTRRTSPLYDPGAASTGIEGAIFTSPMNGGALTTGDTITVTHDINTFSEALNLWEVVPTSGYSISYVTGGVNTGSATASPTVTTGTITSGNVVIAACHSEWGSDNTCTQDGDTTNGTWSTQQSARASTGAGGASAHSQCKVVTATATQTYNPTHSVSHDNICSWVELTEVVATAVKDVIGHGVIPWAR